MGKKGGGGKKGKGKAPKVIDPMQEALARAPGPAPERTLHAGGFGLHGDWWQSEYRGERPPIVARPRPVYESSVERLARMEREQKLLHPVGDDDDPNAIDHVVLSVPAVLQPRLVHPAAATLELGEISSSTSIGELRALAANVLDVPVGCLGIELGGLTLGEDGATLSERHVLNGGALELTVALSELAHINTDWSETAPPPSPPPSPPHGKSKSSLPHSQRQLRLSSLTSVGATGSARSAGAFSAATSAAADAELAELGAESHRLLSQWVSVWQAAPVQPGKCPCCKIAAAWAVLPGCRMDTDGDGVWDHLEEDGGERSSHGHATWCEECCNVLSQDVTFGDVRHARLVSLQLCACCQAEAKEAEEREARVAMAKAEDARAAAAEAKLAADQFVSAQLMAPGNKGAAREDEDEAAWAGESVRSA